jgi:hypothetical protein
MGLRYTILTAAFLVASLPFAYLALMANPSINPVAPLPYVKRASSTQVNLPDVFGRTSTEQGTVTLTILGPEIIVPYQNIGVNVSIQIPGFLLSEWTVVGAGIEFSVDNAIENFTFSFNGATHGFTRPSSMIAYSLNSSSPFEGIWTGHDLVQFTSEGAIAGTARLEWLPKPQFWQNANFNNTDIRLRATTSIQVEPAVTLNSEKQVIFSNRLTLSNEYLTTFLVAIGIAVSTFVAGSYEEKGKRRRKSETDKQETAERASENQLRKEKKRKGAIERERLKR